MFLLWSLNRKGLLSKYSRIRTYGDSWLLAGLRSDVKCVKGGFSGFHDPLSAYSTRENVKGLLPVASLLRGIFEAKDGETGFGAALRSVVPLIATGTRFSIQSRSYCSIGRRACL